jgi:hypothetical protein
MKIKAKDSVKKEERAWPIKRLKTALLPTPTTEIPRAQ